MKAMSMDNIPETKNVLVLALAIADARDAGNPLVEDVLVGQLVEAVRPVQQRILMHGIDGLLEASGG